ADEDRLMEAAQHWKNFAAELGHIRQDAERVAAQVGAENRGAAVEAFDHYWRQVGGGGGQLAQAEQAAEHVAEVLEGFAAVVVASAPGWTWAGRRPRCTSSTPRRRSTWGRWPRRPRAAPWAGRS